MSQKSKPDRTWPPRRGGYRWLTVAIREVVAWPDIEYFQDYDGFEFILLPETTTTPPAVAIELVPPLDFDTARAALRRFLSAYSWVENHAAIDDFGIGSGYPGGVGKEEGPVRYCHQNFRIDYLPSTTAPKARLCLALYREALGLNNDAYRFLAFFKIVNVLHEGGRAQKKWINGTIPKLLGHRALERLAELKTTESDFGHYLYESGRCAVAHAFAQPVADPDDPADTERLSADLPIVQALAEHLIEFELGIKSAATVRKEHLYELKGFNAHLGADIVARLKAKETVKPEELPALPHLSFHVRDHLPRETFLKMQARIINVREGIVIVECIASSELAAVIIELDFPAERLRINPLEGLRSSDNGTSDAMITAMDMHLFWRHIIGNRVVEVWPCEGDQPWGRTAPYVPTNMRFNGDAWKREHQVLFRTYLVRMGNESTRLSSSLVCAE